MAGQGWASVDKVCVCVPMKRRRNMFLLFAKSVEKDQVVLIVSLVFRH